MNTKREVIATFFEEVWTKENTAAIHQIFVPEVENEKTVAGLRKEEKLSPDDFVGFQQALLGIVKEMVISIDDSMEQGDWIAVRCTVNAKSRETGKSVDMTGCGWAKVTDGKIREAHNFFDFLNFFEGLELLPDNTMQNCLTGNGWRDWEGN